MAARAFHVGGLVENLVAERQGLVAAEDQPARLALFESTLHHFYDPVAALRNTAADLAEDGLVAVIEAAAPPVGSEWHDQNVDLMRRYSTIERPYTREQLHEVLAAAGFEHVAFYQPINGLYRQHSDELTPRTAEWATADHLNLCFAAQTEAALARIERGPAPMTDPPAGVRVVPLDNPSVTATVALVTSAAQPGSVLARALVKTAQSARITVEPG